jgi:hypothetical protein
MSSVSLRYQFLCDESFLTNLMKYDLISRKEGVFDPIWTIFVQHIVAQTPKYVMS